MNILKRILLGAAAAGSVLSAGAMSYTNSDLLLVFRQTGFNDVEFDLGSVSNFLGRAAGTQIKVNYDANLVLANFNGSLAGTSFLLLTATAPGDPLPRLWLTDGSQTPAPTDVTYSKFSQIQSKITAVGLQATALTASNAAPAVISLGTVGGYTYVASDANLTPVSSLGGLTPYPVDAVSPATLTFNEVHLSTTTPNPPAALIGSFTLDGSGELTFTAGPLVALTPPTIQRMTRARSTNAITFTTVSLLNYRLRFATSLAGPWNVTGVSVAGDGAPKVLTDASTDALRYYRVEVTH